MKKGFLIALSITGIMGLVILRPAPAESYPQPGTGAGPPAGISMDFQDADLKDVLKVFSQQSGLNFIAGEEIKDRKITLYLDNVSVQDALDNIIEANKLIYEQALDSDIFIVKEKTLLEVEAVTRVYTLDYCRVYIEKKAVEKEAATAYSGRETLEGLEETVDIVYLLKGMLTENGKIAVDRRTNSLIITDIPASFEIIEATIARLDVPIPGIMIEAEVVETTLSALEGLGFKWGNNGQVFSFGLDDADMIFPISIGMWTSDLITGSLGFSNIQAALDMLVSEGKAVILARPRILTLSNEAAEININSNDAISIAKTWEYPETGPAIETVTFERAEEDERPGVSLKVTPVVNKDDLIKMVIEPRVISKVLSEITGMTTEDIVVYDLHFRTAKTTVMVEDGQTVIIGGLISKINDKEFEKIPFLGDIPVIGGLFKHKQIEDTEKELVFFITPHIVKNEVKFSSIDRPETRPSKPSSIPDAQRGLSSQPQIHRSANAGKVEVEKELAIEEAIRQFLAERALAKTR
ncbi:MAG: secretin N-terminal domain-containing protein [Candidatus Omnitrophota bacterium]|nr:secretin N-terminal domain-containing protein [Candidatus Omnitrophota bacterium]